MLGIQLFRGMRRKAIGYSFHSYERLREHWVRWMQRLTKRLTVRQLKIGLISMVVMTAAYCSWIMIDGFTGTPSHALKIEAIRKPGYITTPSIQKNIPAPSIAAGEKDRLQRFLLYMDSLQHTPTGQRMYDSIYHARPGLLDSVRKLLQQ